MFPLKSTFPKLPNTNTPIHRERFAKVSTFPMKWFGIQCLKNIIKL